MCFQLSPSPLFYTHYTRKVVNIWFACWLVKKVCTKILFLFIVISRFDSLNSETPKRWVNDLVVDLWLDLRFGDSDFRFLSQGLTGLALFICFRQLTLVTALYAGVRVADCPTKQSTATSTWLFWCTGGYCETLLQLTMQHADARSERQNAIPCAACRCKGYRSFTENTVLYT